jgi:hypothetical protein
MRQLYYNACPSLFLSYGATLNEEKFKHAGLAQQNGFGPAFLLRMLRLEKGTAKPYTCC